MRADNSRDGHEGYANSMHTTQKVKNALIVIKSQTTDTRCNSHLQASHSHLQHFQCHLQVSPSALTIPMLVFTRPQGSHRILVTFRILYLSILKISKQYLTNGQINGKHGTDYSYYTISATISSQPRYGVLLFEKRPRKRCMMATSTCSTGTTVKSPNNGHFGNGSFVLYSEVVLISEVCHTSIIKLIIFNRVGIH